MEASLARGRTVQAHFRDWRARQLALISHVVSSDPAFVGYVAEAVARGRESAEGVDSLSIADLLAERQGELGFDFAIVLDDEGRVLARTDRAGGGESDLASDPLVARALEELVPVTGLWRSRGKVQQAAVVPIDRNLELVGFLVTGLAVNDSLAHEISRVSGTDAVFLVASTDRKLEVIASSLDIERSKQIARSFEGRPDLLETLLRDGRGIERFALDVGGVRLVATLDPLVDAAGRPFGAIASVDTADAHAAAFGRIRSVVIAAGILSMFVAGALSFVLARRTFRPVQQLADAAQAAVAGDYSRTLDVPRDQELGGMARAFNTLLRDLRERREMESYVSEISKHLPDQAIVTRPWRRASNETAAPLDASGAIGSVPSAGHAPPSSVPTATGLPPLSAADQVTRADPTRPTGRRAGRSTPSGAGQDHLEMGAVIGDRYEVLEVLGEGGMGVVYKAHDRELQELVALKILRSGAVATAQQLEQIKGEIRLARKITHPNVLRTYDYGEHEGRPYISMEYVRGMTLRYLLFRKDGLPTAPALFLLGQLCDGLSVAHAAGVLHRDIKPENIIIDQHGNAKLMDFGIAAPTRREGGSGAAGTVFGTPLYLAPDLLMGEPGDVRGDIYATGVVIFELFTGRLPFEERSIDDLLEEKRRVPPPPSRFRPGMPHCVDAIVATCLDPDPARRYADVATLRRDLDRLRG